MPTSMVAVLYGPLLCLLSVPLRLQAMRSLEMTRRPGGGVVLPARRKPVQYQDAIYVQASNGKYLQEYYEEIFARFDYPHGHQPGDGERFAVRAVHAGGNLWLHMQRFHPGIQEVRQNHPLSVEHPRTHRFFQLHGDHPRAWWKDMHNEWKIEDLDSSGNDHVVKWGDHVRFRHTSGVYWEVMGNKVKAFRSEKSDSQKFVILGEGGGGSFSQDLADEGPLGNRDETLNHLGICAGTVYNANHETDTMYGKDGWKPIKHVLDSYAQIQAGAFQNEKYPNVTVVAFRGTQSAKSVLEDIQIALGNPDWESALQFFNDVRSQVPSSKFYVTGHSLGGYYAQVVASRANVEGVAFNTPGPVWKCTGFYRPNFEVHLANDDPLQPLFPGDPLENNIASPHWWDSRCHCEAGPYFNLCGGFNGPRKTCDQRIAEGGSRIT